MSILGKYRIACAICGKEISGADYKIVGIDVSGYPDKLPRNVYRHVSCEVAAGQEIPTLHKLTCERCGDWFFSDDTADKYCSDNCRGYAASVDANRHYSPELPFYDARQTSVSEFMEALSEAGPMEIQDRSQLDQLALKVADQGQASDCITEPVQVNAPIIVKIEPTRRTPFRVRNEMGVIVMFGKIAERLNYHLIDIGTAFPDATMLSPTDQKILVEFEYQASNFIVHKHDPKGCDLVVCWDADARLLVPTIALSDYYQQDTGTWDFRGVDRGNNLTDGFDSGTN
jgi:hypothetical protein